jgi:phytoene synthase
VREPAIALYAFCRRADDAIDGRADALAELERLRERLESLYAGAPADFAEDRALADVVERFAIPREIPAALLDAFEWDARGRRYADYGALTAYAVRVAGTVGVMMSLLMGGRAPQVLARACDLGVAMQLSNIARDVGEDARAGRLYLPSDWLAEAGIDAARWLLRPRFTPALAGVVRRLLEVAETLYARAEAGITELPAACRPGIYAARFLYAQIGHEVARHGFDSLTRRAVVPPARKLLSLGRAVAAPVRAGAADRAPPLDEARFLIDAVNAAPWPAGRARAHDALCPDDGALAGLLNLFARLERRDGGALAPPLVSEIGRR